MVSPRSLRKVRLWALVVAYICTFDMELRLTVYVIRNG